MQTLGLFPKKCGSILLSKTIIFTNSPEIWSQSKKKNVKNMSNFNYLCSRSNKKIIKKSQNCNIEQTPCPYRSLKPRENLSQSCAFTLPSLFPSYLGYKTAIKKSSSESSPNKAQASRGDGTLARVKSLTNGKCL